MKLLSRIASDKTAATALEYGLALGLITFSVFTAIQSLGSSVNDTYQMLSQELHKVNKTK